MKQCIDPSPPSDCFQMLPSPKLLFTREEEEEEGEEKKKPKQTKESTKQTPKQSNQNKKPKPNPKLWQTLSLLYYKRQPCLGKPQPVLQKVARD